jgi:NADPH-ferrihemoprotein reductase
MGKFFDKRFEELGAKRVFELGLGNANENTEEDFEDWKSRALPELSTLFQTRIDAGSDVIEQRYELVYHNDVAPDAARDPFTISKLVPDAKNPYLSKVLVKRQLLKHPG